MALGKKKMLHQAADSGLVNTDNFAPVTYTGNGSTQSISSLDFQPDLVWVKQRSGTGRNVLTDSVRGAERILYSELAGGETIYAGRGLTSFDSNGFTVDDTGAINYSVNHSGTYVAWCWKAGGAAVSGTGTGGASSVSYSANTASGFSIVEYTKSGTTGTMTHGLNSAPELILEKRTDDTAYWNVRVTGVTGNNQTIYLNQSTEVSTHPSLNLWTTPTTSVFGYDSANAAAGDYIAYCFHSVDGYQKVGSYSGAAARATVSGLGFKPRFVMIKNATTANTDWYMWDNQRNTITDKLNNYLLANTNNAESGASTYALFVGDTQTAPVTNYEDGFQVAAVDNIQINKTGNTYIYLAIA